LPVRNTAVQLLSVYTYPERHNAECYKRTDGTTEGQTEGQTDNIKMPIADHAV